MRWGISVLTVDVNSERMKSHSESDLNKVADHARESCFGSKPRRMPALHCLCSSLSRKKQF